MRLKSCPEDFRVTELAEWKEVPDGDFHVYRIEKRKLTTHQALERVRDQIGVAPNDVSFAGLKDRQAITTQFIAVRGKIIQGKVAGVRYDAVGRTNEPLGTGNLLGNRFTVVVRRLTELEAGKARSLAAGVGAWGLPNYYDDQRFGSIKEGQGLPARDMILGDFESAVRRLLTLPARRDPPAEVARKGIIREHWGNWALIARKTRGGNHQALIKDLATHGGDFRGAIRRMSRSKRAVHLLAYQAYIWNETVGRLVQQVLPASSLRQASYACDRHLFWAEPNELTDERYKILNELEVPLIWHRTVASSETVQAAIEATLEAEKLELPHFLVPGVPEAWFKEVPRRVMLKPKDMEVGQPEPDEDSPGFFKVELSFSLPPGAYATLVLMRIFKARPYREEYEIERSWHKFTPVSTKARWRGGEGGRGERHGNPRERSGPDRGERRGGPRERSGPDRGERSEQLRARNDRDRGERSEQPRARNDRDRGERSEQPRARNDRDRGERSEQPRARKDRDRGERSEQPRARNDRDRGKRSEQPRARGQSDQREPDAPEQVELNTAQETEGSEKRNDDTRPAPRRPKKGSKAIPWKGLADKRKRHKKRDVKHDRKLKRERSTWQSKKEKIQRRRDKSSQESQGASPTAELQSSTSPAGVPSTPPASAEAQSQKRGERKNRRKTARKADKKRNKAGGEQSRGPKDKRSKKDRKKSKRDQKPSQKGGKKSDGGAEGKKRSYKKKVKSASKPSSKPASESEPGASAPESAS